MLKSWWNFYRRKFKTRTSCEIFDPSFPLDPFLFAFFRGGASDRAVIARECIHRGPGGAVFYFCIAARERRTNTKPWPESLVIRSAVNSFNEALNSLSRFARLPGRFFAKSTPSSPPENSRYKKLASIKQ